MTKYVKKFVYVYRDAEGFVPYVGCTSNYQRRRAEHKTTKEWFCDVDEGKSFCFTVHNPNDALNVERECIEKYTPVYNTQSNPAVIEADLFEDVFGFGFGGTCASKMRQRRSNLPEMLDEMMAKEAA